MAGILDSKSRVLDFVLTQEGRNQLANDSLEFRFASLSDSACFYRSGSDFAADDASLRIHFEANSSPFDQIVIERGPEGQSVVGFGVNTGSIRIVGETIYQTTGSAHVAAATTTLSFNKGDGLHGLTAGQKITLIDFGGTKVDYFVSDTGDGGVAHLGAVANGATLKSTGGIKAERSFNSDKGIAVGFNLSAALPGGTDQAEFAALLKAAIEHANGHAGTIKVGPAPVAANAVINMTLSQATTGQQGNRKIDENISNLSVPNFSGGKDDVVGSGLIEGSAIDASDLILRGITDNLKNLNMIGGFDPFSDSDHFKIRLSSGKKIDDDNFESTFTISDTVPWNLKSGHPESHRREHDLEISESFFEDDRTNFVDNFLYLPPINKVDDSGVLYPLAQYENLSRTPLTTLDELQSSFLKDEDQLNLPERKRVYRKEFVDISFEETSRDNNLMIQPFEFRDQSIRKLETVDFGEFIDEETGERTRVFFVGKVMNDFRGIAKFVNLFTVVCKNDEALRRNRGVI